MIRKAERSYPLARTWLMSASLLLSLAGASLVGERQAAAQTRFGDKGQLVISAENLFSFTSERVGQSRPSGDISENHTRIGFLYSGSSVGGMVSPLGPQVGGHYFIIPSLSLGGTIGYESRGGSVTTNVTNNQTTTTVTTNLDDESTFILLPKVGYAWMLKDTLGFWFRGGIGVGRVTTSGPGNPTKTGDTFWLFSADALFVMTPIQHVGFFVGPEANLSFAGTHSQTANNGIDTSFSSSFRSIAIGAGLLGYVDL